MQMRRNLTQFFRLLFQNTFGNRPLCKVQYGDLYSPTCSMLNLLKGVENLSLTGWWFATLLSHCSVEATFLSGKTREWMKKKRTELEYRGGSVAPRVRNIGTSFIIDSMKIKEQDQMAKKFREDRDRESRRQAQRSPQPQVARTESQPSQQTNVTSPPEGAASTSRADGLTPSQRQQVQQVQQEIWTQEKKDEKQRQEIYRHAEAVKTSRCAQQ